MQGSREIKVSVVIPVYNVAPYLRQCLNSVANQTLREIEIICVDDGSTDGSSAILAEYAAKDPRVKVVSREHTNAGAARNAGMAAATGEYLGFVDSDDWCDLTLFEKAYAKAKAHDADVVLWRHRDCDDAGLNVKSEIAFNLPSGVKHPFDGGALKDKLFSSFNYAPWNRMVKRDFAGRFELEFQPIERSNDVSFGCLALAAASRISIVDEALYNYRIRISGSLQTENDKTPLSIVEAWKHLASRLFRLGLLERYRKAVALASMYCFVRTLDVLSKCKNEYGALFDALKTLFAEDAFFATVRPEEVGNDIMSDALRAIKNSESSTVFSMQWAAGVYKWMMKFFRDRETARRELLDMGKNLSVVEKELSATRTELDVVKKTLSDVAAGFGAKRKGLWEEISVGRLPGVSLIVVSNGDAGCRKAFERYLEKASMADTETIYVDCISTTMLDGVSKDYVAILGDNDRYINDYALELLVNTARCEHADVVGGMTSDASVRIADFVFDAGWLRENEDLLSVMREDGQAFIASAIARARKHIVENRVYTEYIRPATAPLVSIVVPAYNVERYIDRCMASLTRQTHRNLEIIVVDDGSTDSTASLCDAWARKDARIQVRHKKNGGQSSARNVGMRMAKGKYIGFVDSDDYVDAEMFGDLAEILECHPWCDVAKCGVAVEYTYEVSNAELKFTQAYFQNPVEGETRPRFDIVQETDVGPVDKLYRLDFLRGNGIEFPEGTENEDEAFFFEVYCRMRNCYYTSRQYYHYLRNPQGTMARQSEVAREGRLPDAVKVYDFVAELLDRENRRDLLGVLYRHMVGCVQRFADSPIEDKIGGAIARILRKTNAFYYVDLICGGDRQWVQKRVFELMNRWQSANEAASAVSGAWFPKSAPSRVRFSERPLVSFIVPVYNVEKYIAVALETLRRQTLSDFEVICIDDGSTDDSGKILDFYAKADSRIKVWHFDNRGVSAARNFGLSKARGRYVAFLDGDDRLHPRMAGRTVLAAERDGLDTVMFDYRCFAYDSLKPIDHYWRLAHHIDEFPRDRVFATVELDRLPVYGSCCTYLWRREFLESIDARFSGIKLGEDLVWVLSVLSKAARMSVLNVPFYEYRRGNPSSAVSRLQTNEGEAPVMALKGLADVISKTESHRIRTILVRRMVNDILFYGERMPKALRWLRNGGFDEFGGVDYLKRVCGDQRARLEELLRKDAPDAAVGIEYFIKRTPKNIQRLMRNAIAARKDTAKDMFIVCGQLNSTTNEPIDSWTFFRWLQDHGIPSRYVAWRKHSMIGRMRADNGLKDVILLSGNGVDDFEFIEKCRDVLPRLKAVVMENTALNPLTWRYFHMLPECDYVFLQHGVTFWKMATKLASSFSVANYVNVSSEKERAFLETYVPEHPETGRRPRYLIAGLPRWDLLRDESAREREKVVFYMPTWRATFNSGMDAIAKSAYFAGVRALVSEEHLARLKKRGLRLVMAAHHHLVNHVKNLDFGLPIDLVRQSEISYWIRHASLCVTDYSSVSFDFLFLNKPCIFWTPDRYDGLLQADDCAETVFAEHQAANMFNRVHSAEEVMAMIEKYADSGFRLEPEKRAICDQYFAYRTNVCQHLYDEICAVAMQEAGT